MKVKIGHRDYGFSEINKVPTNVINKSRKIDYKKFVTWAGLSTALYLMFEPEEAFASGSIDTSPIDNFFKEVYWVILKVAGYISTPVIGWAGYNLVVSGTSSEKRMLAKSILIWVVIGLGVIAGAPWASKALIALWGRLF